MEVKREEIAGLTVLLDVFVALQPEKRFVRSDIAMGSWFVAQ